MQPNLQNIGVAGRGGQALERNSSEENFALGELEWLRGTPQAFCKATRLALGMTPTFLANELKIKPRVIFEAEKGTPSRAYVDALISYGIALDALWFDEKRIESLRATAQVEGMEPKTILLDANLPLDKRLQKGLVEFMKSIGLSPMDMERIHRIWAVPKIREMLKHENAAAFKEVGSHGLSASLPALRLYALNQAMQMAHFASKRAKGGSHEEYDAFLQEYVQKNAFFLCNPPVMEKKEEEPPPAEKANVPEPKKMVSAIVAAGKGVKKNNAVEITPGKWLELCREKAGITTVNGAAAVNRTSVDHWHRMVSGESPVAPDIAERMLEKAALRDKAWVSENRKAMMTAVNDQPEISRLR